MINRPRTKLKLLLSLGKETETFYETNNYIILSQMNRFQRVVTNS